MKADAVPQKTTLIIKAPKLVENSFEKFASFFKDLHKFIKDRKKLSIDEKTISLELFLKENYFHYRIVVFSELAGVVKNLFYSQFPEAEISEIPCTEELTKNTAQLYKEYVLERSNYLPLKTNFSADDDPYLILSAVLSNLKH